MTDTPMKKLICLSPMMALVLIAGCASPEKISFNDEAPLARLKPLEPSVSPVKKGLPPAERGKIEREVLVWLLASPVGSDSVYSAVFLQVDEAGIASLIKQFPNHVPPIKQLWHLETRPGQSPLDKDTSRKALILSVDVLEPENGTVVALGRWFAGDAAAGFHTFVLKPNGNQWQILTVK